MIAPPYPDAPVLDMAALEKIAEYDGGYTAKSEVVKWFWAYLKQLSDEKKQVRARARVVA